MNKTIHYVWAFFFKVKFGADVKHVMFLFHQVLYVVVWCAVFSTLHLYITVSDYWVLCLCVSLVSIFITTAVIFVLHHSNKEVTLTLSVGDLAAGLNFLLDELVLTTSFCVRST